MLFQAVLVHRMHIPSCSRSHHRKGTYSDNKIAPTDAVTALTIAANDGENHNADIDGDGKVASLGRLMSLQAAVGNIAI
nr:hypothetical protein GZ37B2_39 [uncultured archaeon GZfos37B2]